MSSTTATNNGGNGPAVNYKLKNNPFFANRNQEKDAKPPLAKFNKSPVTQSSTSKLPKPATPPEPRKHVRASVQKMASSSNVSSNPWKAKMLKQSAPAKKMEPKAAVENVTSKPALEKDSPSAAPEKSLDTLKSSTSPSTPLDTAKSSTAISKPLDTVEPYTSTNKPSNSVKRPASASKGMNTTKSSASISKSLNIAKSAAKIDKSLDTAKLTPSTSESSDTVKPSSNISKTIKAIKPSSNISKPALPKPSKDAPHEGSPEKTRQRLGPATTKKTATEPLVMSSSIAKKANAFAIAEKGSDADKTSLKKATSKPPTKPELKIDIPAHPSQPNPHTEKVMVQETKRGVDRAMKSASPVPQVPPIPSVLTHNVNDKPNVTTAVDDDDEKPLATNQSEKETLTLDSMLESLRPASGSTQHSASSFHSFSDTDSDNNSNYDHPEATTAATVSTTSSKRITAFGIELPWCQYAPEPCPPVVEPNTDTRIDSAKIALQLAVPHAVLAAIDFPTLSMADAEKWRKRYAKAKSNVDTIRDRVFLETRIQRTYASLLKLAVDNESRSLVIDLHTRTTRIDQLAQELYYAFSHACESQEKYLHHIAGTLAIPFQDDQSIVIPSKKRHEDVVLRLESLAKKCSIHIPTHDDVPKIHMENLSDDGDFSDDSMFHASVRTSMTSFDDHQQAHALLDIIERQLSETPVEKSVDKRDDLENEIVRLRKREVDMQHRLDVQSEEFAKQRKEWECRSTATLEEQLEREIAGRKSLEQAKTSLERESRQRQEKLQRQLEDQKKNSDLQLEKLNRSLVEANQREQKLQHHQTELTRRIQALEAEAERYQNQHNLSDNAKVTELSQTLLQASQREKELAQKVQQLETAALESEGSNQELRNLDHDKQLMESELKDLKQREVEARDRLDALNGQVNQALTATSTASLEAMVTKILEPSNNTDTELSQLHEAFKNAQEEYTRREAALMLQSASVEAELDAVFKEYDKLTRNIADFNHERKKYEQHVQTLMRDKQLLDKQLADYKVKASIGKDGQTMTLRKEFRQLMATVKTEHEQAFEKEIEKRRHVEHELRNMKHELELKRWDTVNTSVQTSFVAYPIM